MFEVPASTYDVLVLDCDLERVAEHHDIDVTHDASISLSRGR